MKKTVLLFFLFSVLFASAQFNFSFKFYNTNNTQIGVNTPIQYDNANSWYLYTQQIDLSQSVCEGDQITIKNFSNGSLLPSIGNYSLTSTTLWDVKPGYTYKTNPNLSFDNAWSTSGTIIDNQIWNNNTGITYTIPNSTGSGQYAYHTILIAPVLNGHFAGVYNSNSGCQRVIALKIKVKKAPICITNKNICEGESITNMLLGIESGITASNWLPNDPRINTPTQNTNYSVTLSNGTCSFNCSFSIKIIKPEFELISDNYVCGGNLPYLSDISVFDYNYKKITINNLVVFDNYNITNNNYFDSNYYLKLNSSGIYNITVTYMTYSGEECSKTYTINLLKSIKIPLPTIFSMCNNFEQICAPLAPAGSNYSYQWWGPSAGSNSSTLLSTSSCFTPNVHGSFLLKVTNQYGCSETHHFSVTNSIPQPNLGSNIVVCKGERMPTISIPYEIFGNSGYTITWYINGIVVQNGGTTLQMSPGNGSTVTVTISKSGCKTPSNSITVTIQDCNPTAIMSITNGERINSMSSKYGPINVPEVCLPGAIIDGSASHHENSYFVELAKFDLTTWSDIGSPLYSGWVPGGTTVPNYLNVSTLLGTNLNLQTGVVYRFRLAVGPIWHSTDVFFTVKTCRSSQLFVSKSEENPIDEKVMIVYPNPIESDFSIQLQNESNGKLEIIDITGRIIYTEEFKSKKNFELSLENNNSGIYLVKITSDTITTTKKIIKK